MTMDERFVAIVAGSVSAGVVLITIIIILVFCLCRKTRQRNELKEAHRNLSINTLNPEDGMPATLPKVGSNGLWIPSQSMLTAAPSTAYSQVKPNSKQPRDQLYRATSEPRLPDGSTGYQGNLKIYHSQQLPALREDYEPLRYDRYLGVRPNSIPSWDEEKLYNSRAMLIENGFQVNQAYDHQSEDRGRPRVRRTSSDITSSQRYKPRSRDALGGGIPYADKNFTAVVEVHQQRALPARSYWGPNRGPNKEKVPYQNNKLKSVPDDIPDHSLARQAQLPSNLYPGQTSSWDPSTQYRVPDSLPSTTVYSPDDNEQYQASTVPRYQDVREDNFRLELKTTYSSQTSKPVVVDQSVQADVTDGLQSSTSVNNTISSKQSENEEDGGYFTSSGRTDILMPKDDPFRIEKPHDIDMASENTDLASTGKHVTAQAFEFLQGYLSDEDVNS